MLEGVILFALGIALLPLLFLSIAMLVMFLGLWYICNYLIRNIEKRLHGMVKRG